jgi:hypothetical protein
MFSSKATIDEALADFQMLRNHQPFRFGGKWFVARTESGFTAYRTKAAASRNAADNNIWVIAFGS